MTRIDVAGKRRPHVTAVVVVAAGKRRPHCTAVVVVAVACSALCATIACGPETSADADVSFSTPAALDCAQVPALSARLWVSGSGVPCDMSVDGAVTSGSCTTRPGRVRTLTLEWFVHDDAHALDLVLAQVRGTVNLENEKDAEVPFDVKAADVTTFGCLDVSADQVSGKETIVVGGDNVPVCDVDNSCNGAAGDACTNLGELCAGSDPFDPTSEP
jgi:hypothetical protein